MVRCGTAVKAWFGLSGSGTVRQGSWGVAGSGSDRHVMVRQLRLVKACFGMVSCGMAVMVSHGRCGTFRYGLLWQLRFVRVS
jgi:hypothetical protein